MDKVQKTVGSQCYVPSSEPFGIHGDIHFIYLVVVCCSHDSVSDFHRVLAEHTFPKYLPNYIGLLSQFSIRTIYYYHYSTITIFPLFSRNFLSSSFYCLAAYNNGCILQIIFRNSYVILSKYIAIFLTPSHW